MPRVTRGDEEHRVGFVLGIGALDLAIDEIEEFGPIKRVPLRDVTGADFVVELREALSLDG
ncbi:hypothetical protein [Sulfuricurvum kujiense]|uniref:hypothetical protein n=1 Tax=Sulfuricurvum kujiense TaxID=148813 RepID=UPI001CB6E6B1|nr:hypothetical protein [Sulfuricurvum kujiense]